EDFIHYIQIERGLADNTLEAYQRDLTKYLNYLHDVVQINDWQGVDHTVVTHFLYHMNDQGAKSTTIARTLSTLRKFHQFLVMDRSVSNDPTIHIESPKKARTLPKVLSAEEVDQLLSIETVDPLSTRNKAMVETLYATGLRVSELIDLTMSDLHL